MLSPIPPGLNRAQFLRRAAGFSAAALAGPGLLAACGGEDATERTSRPRLSAEPGNLRILEWAGYEVPALWKPYAKRFPDSKPKFTFFAVDDEALAKARAGADVDMAHPGLGYARDWYNAELIQPWDLSLIPNAKDLNPSLLETGQIDGEQYHMTTDWGFESALYRKDKVEPSEQSLNLLYDERYAGKISWWDDVHNIVIWGYVNGVDDPWKMSDEELEDARGSLSETKKKVVRNLWTTQTDFEQDFAAGNIWIGYAWPASWVNMRKKGLDVEYMDPKEGWLVWQDGFVLLKETDDYHHAHAYVDAWASPQTGVWLLENYAYGTPNTAVDLDELDQALVKAFRLDDPKVLQEPQSHPRQWIERRREYNRTWDQIKAA